MALSVRDCSFAYPRRAPVFEGLAIDFEPGRTVLLGPNGAGKSTLLALCAGVARPKRGRVAIGHLDNPRASSYRRRVAWLPQTVEVFPGLRVSEQLAYYGWLKGMRASEAKARCAEVLETVRLAPLANKRAAELSGGQLRRLGIAGALLHGADVILLDEPFAGLDPSQRESLDDALRAIPPAKIVVVSTHQTDDLNSVYGRTVVLSSGVIRFDGSTADFLQAGAGAKDEARAAYGAHVGAED